MRDDLVDIILCFDENIYTEKWLSNFQEFLCNHFPGGWLDNLVLYQESKNKKHPVDLSRKNSIYEKITEHESEKGPLYYELIEKYGGNDRVFGWATFKGKDDSLILSVVFDEQGFRVSSGRWLWGNLIHIELEHSSCKEENPSKHYENLFELLVKNLSPIFGRANLKSEFDAKNIQETPAFMAIGSDVSRYLPGLYWGNYYGEKYVDLIGKDVLLSSSAHHCLETDQGVLVYLGESPLDWDSPEYKAREEKVFEEYGNRYIFARDKDNKTQAPDFGLPELPKHPRFS